MADIKTKLCGIELDNPVIAASGSFGYGKEFEEFYDINRLGAFSFKGTTFEPRFGNNTPRIAECDSGMLISIGLQNPGVHAVAEKELPRLKESYHKKVLANVCGFTPEEYRDIIEVLENCAARDIIGWYEVNISCPNVSEGGSCIGTSAVLSESLVKMLRAVTKKPLIMKLTPNVTDVAEVAKACEAGGADGISLINTLYGMVIDLKKKKPVLANKMGGYCGTAAFPIALRNPRCRNRRSFHTRARYPDDACGSVGCRSGSGKSHRPLHLPEDNRRAARDYGQIRNKVA